MKQFTPTLSEQDMALIATALDCLVKQGGLQVVKNVSDLLQLLDASEAK